VTPYYERGDIRIYHGDCMGVIGSLSADLLLTDPPYGIGCARAIHCTKPSRPNTYTSPPKYDTERWDAKRPDSDVFATMFAATSSQIIWGGNYFADMLPPSRGWLFWDKRFENTTNMSHGELAWTSFNRRLLKFTISSKAETAGGRLRVHPTQKPVALMRWCLQQAPSALTVLDPFAGSGSTLVAAYREMRAAVGIEIEERYCEIAAKRLEREVLPLEATA
jgi:site-specific DNA-methyltransferase (adenine-specific)